MDRRRRWCCVVVLGGVLAASAGRAQGPAKDASGGAPVRHVFQLARADLAWGPSRHDGAGLCALWPQFAHRPYAEAGFNHTTLPFLYHDRVGDGDRAEAWAFSFLVSHGLDLTPGCYCSRHAYFCFKRDREAMRLAAEGYRPPNVRRLIANWGGSHAVGGTLTRVAGGFTGELRLFARDGSLALAKAYERPQAYFDLLGDVLTDAMGFFGYVPPAELVRHLHQPQCSSHESVLELGRAAFAEERSEAEFGLYRSILRRDPGFRLVRDWYANQSFWRAYGQPGEAGAMPAVPESGLQAEFHQWPDVGRALVGDRHQDRVRAQIGDALKAGRVSPEDLTRFTRFAAQYPNQYWLLLDLADLHDRGDGPGDGDGPYEDVAMAQSIRVAAYGCQFQTGLSDRGDAEAGLADGARSMGRYDIATQFLDRCLTALQSDGGNRDRIATVAMAQGRYLAEAGHLPSARQAFATARDMASRIEQQGHAAAATVALAVMAGDEQAARSALRDWRSPLEAAEALPLAEAYVRTLSREPFDDAELCLRAKGSAMFWLALVLACELDLRDGQVLRHPDLRQWLAYQPHVRSWWILEEAYRRQGLVADDPGFYRAVALLHPDDPWVRQAAAAYAVRRRAQAPAPGGAQEGPADTVAQTLAAFAPDIGAAASQSPVEAARGILVALAPGRVAAQIAALLEAGAGTEAEATTEAEAIAEAYLRVARAARIPAARWDAARLLAIVHAAPAGKRNPTGGTQR